MKKAFLKHSAGKLCIFFGPHRGESACLYGFSSDLKLFALPSSFTLLLCQSYIYHLQFA